MKLLNKIPNEKSKAKNSKNCKVRSCLTEEQIRLNNLNQEHGSSSWLTTLPLSEEGHDLTKQLFWDLIRIRYGWTLTRLPAYCECGEKFDLQHDLSCKKGGFVSLRHNLVRNITSSPLSEVCKDVRVEPQLQPLTGESLAPSTATGNEVRLNVCARGFSQAGQMAFFDVRCLIPMPEDMQSKNSRKHINLMKRRRNAITTNELCRLNMAHLHHLYVCNQRNGMRIIKILFAFVGVNK